MRLVGVARPGPEGRFLRGGGGGDGSPEARVRGEVTSFALEPVLEVLRPEGRVGTVASGFRPKDRMGSEGRLAADRAPTETGPGWDHHT